MVVFSSLLAWVFWSFSFLLNADGLCFDCKCFIIESKDMSMSNKVVSNNGLISRDLQLTLLVTKLLVRKPSVSLTPVHDKGREIFR